MNRISIFGIFACLAFLSLMWELKKEKDKENLPICLLKTAVSIEQIIQREAFEIKEFQKGQKYAYYKTTLNLLSFEDACDRHEHSKGYQVSFTDERAEKERIRVYWIHCSQDSIFATQAQLIFFEEPDTFYFTKKYREEWQIVGSTRPVSDVNLDAGEELIELTMELKNRWRQR